MDYDERIEALLRDLWALHGMNPNAVTEGVGRHLAQYEEMFRSNEVDERKKDAAALRCRKLIRERVQGVAKDEATAAHWRIVLAAIDSPARAPLPPKA
jgi:hypothetical protein